MYWIVNKIALWLFLYYNFKREVEMNFFREHKKVIVGIIAVSVILWMVGGVVLMALLSFGG